MSRLIRTASEILPKGYNIYPVNLEDMPEAPSWTGIDAEPRLGTCRIVSSDELGRERAEEIVRRSTSKRVEPVRQLLKHGVSTQAIFAQQYVRSSHDRDGVVARTRAVIATGFAPGDVGLSATYSAEYSAAFSEQAEALRYGTNSNFLQRGEAIDMFGFVGPLHLAERLAFLRAGYEQVRNSGVASRTIVEVTDWVRGAGLCWFKLPAQRATRVAEMLWSDLEQVKDLDDQILDALRKGNSPDEAMVAKRNALKLSLAGYGLFFGFEYATEVQREPLLGGR